MSIYNFTKELASCWLASIRSVYGAFLHFDYFQKLSDQEMMHHLLIIIILAIIGGLIILTIIMGNKRYNRRRIKEVEKQSYLQAKDQLHSMLVYDDLTRLLTKYGFETQARNYINNRAKDGIAIVLGNIMRFKAINSLFGYKKGDEILISIGKFLFANITDGVCARLNSDTFAICMPKDNLDVGILVELEKKLAQEGIALNSRIKLGIYLVVDNTTPISEMTDNASLALKKAKSLPDVKYCYYDETLKNDLIREQAIVDEFDKALEENQFHVYLQPVVSLRYGSAKGAEALVRWVHPERGVISPAQFIPVLERDGLIVKLDYYVWEQVFKYIKYRIDNNKPLLKFSVNLSRQHLYNDKLVGVLTSLSKKYQIPPTIVRLEITETIYIENPEEYGSILAKLRAFGFSIVMDDFGSGYSSLNALADLSVDMVKLDMKFFANKKRTKANSIIMSSIQMLHNIGIEVVAEGVEDKEQVDMLYSLGCDYIQGFYFYKPMNISEFDQADNYPIQIKAQEIVANRSKIQADINQLKNIENFKGLEAVVDSIPCGFGVIGITKDNNIRSIFRSNKIEETLGYSSEDHLYLAEKIEENSLLHPDDIPEILIKVKQAIKTNSNRVELTYRYLRKDGNYHWVTFSAKCVGNDSKGSLWYGAFTDINDIKLNTERLQSNLNLMNHIYDTLVCAITVYTVGADKRILFANKIAYESFGYSSEQEFVESYEKDYAIHPDDQEIIRKAVAMAQNNGRKPVTYTHRIVNKNNSIKWYKGTLLEVVLANNVVAIQSSFLDVTEEMQKS